MSDSERGSVGLFAFPISDPPLRFHDFLYEYWHQLGSVSGAVIHWRPIGDPAQSDEEYCLARTSSLEKRDQEDSVKFRDEVNQLGSEDWLCRREYQRYAKKFGVEDIEPPLVVFTAKPLREKAILKFEPVLFDKPEWKRELAAIFTKNLTAQAFSNLRTGGVFTDKTMEAVQRYLWQVGQKIFWIYSPRKRKLPSFLKAGISKSLVEDQFDPGRDTKLRWWLRKDGSLAIHTITFGNVDGKVEFSLQSGSATKQQKFVMLLIHNHPNPVILSEVLHSIYPDLPLTPGKDAKEIRIHINRARALVNAIRKKLKAGGIPKEILPSVKLDVDLYYKLRLNVAEILQAEKDY